MYVDSLSKLVLLESFTRPSVGVQESKLSVCGFFEGIYDVHIMFCIAASLVHIAV